MFAQHASTTLANAMAPTGKAHPLLAGLPAVTPAGQPIAEPTVNCVAGEVPALTAQASRSAITAAARGSEWLTRYDCVSWCTLDHAGADGQPGWHQGPIVTALAPAPNVNGLITDEPDTLFEARVTQTRAESAVWGIDSKIWLDCGSESMELDVAATDQFIASTEAFLLKLRGLRDQLAIVARDDFPADEEKKAAYMAAQDARIKAIDAAKAGR
ncbi:hypothetical protein ABT224_16215 [Streptomyces sp. NPDC001584]|uniref:DUF6907 domain-containing protein n=1 Tax=Streptomyces sp. NPDC001584 TaxID=3154521 RepID=UPI003332EC51